MSSIGHPKKYKRQLSITDAFFRASQNKKELNNKENIHGDDEGIEEDQENIQQQPLKKTKRVFQTHWKIKFPWAYHIKDINRMQRIKYAWCEEFKANTPFAIEGSKPIQICALNTHDES